MRVTNITVKQETTDYISSHAPEKDRKIHDPCLSVVVHE